MTSSKTSTSKGQSLHRSTFSLGDETKTFYLTTHAESFSESVQTDQKLVFAHKTPVSIPDPSSITTGTSYTSTHSRDVHCPKPVISQNVLHSLRQRNRTHNDEGLNMKEVTNPSEATPYTSTYHTQHCCPAAHSSPTFASGLPTSWHQHDILTGEERRLDDPENHSRMSRDKLLWASRHREADHNSLLLY